MRIAERLARNTVCCTVSDNLERAAYLLWQNECGGVPVVNESGQMTGTITDRDICMAALTSGKRLAELLVGDTMARDLASSGPTDSWRAPEMVMGCGTFTVLP